MFEWEGRQRPGYIHEIFIIMRYAFFIISCFLLFSCSDSFIKHKLKYEKIGTCSEVPESIKMLANINGVRYEFYRCLDDGFDGKNYTVERSGDSVFVNFQKTATGGQSLYKLILDVDAKPPYNHIILDGRHVAIRATVN